MDFIIDPESFFKNVYKVLKPGGYFGFTIPVNESTENETVLKNDINGERKDLADHEAHGRLVQGVADSADDDTQEITRTLSRIGFQVIRHETFFGYSDSSTGKGVYYHGFCVVKEKDKKI